MCDCTECEEMIQPYLDRTLSEPERREAEEHLAGCAWCSKRYRFETELRHFVRFTSEETMRPELKAKLAALRTPLL
jgi:anti-sigma factor RsiW